MSTHTATLEVATIGQQCTLLHLPAVAAQCAQLAEQAIRERRTHLGYLEALLQAELEGTRTAAHSPAHSRSASAANEDPRRVRFRAEP